MYSREETQKLKREFWVTFADKYPRKWVLYDTKIKDFSFKFYVDNKKAQVIIDIEPRNDEIRKAYFDKLVALKNILEEEFIKDLVYEENHTLESGKKYGKNQMRQPPTKPLSCLTPSPGILYSTTVSSNNKTGKQRRK